MKRKKSSVPISRVLSSTHLSIIAECLSFIYADSHLSAQAFYPPPHPRKENLGGLPRSVVYMNLQLLDSTARTITRRLVVSYTTFSPLPLLFDSLFLVGGRCVTRLWRLFSSASPTVASSFYFRKQDTLTLPGLSSDLLMEASDRAGTLPSCDAKLVHLRVTQVLMVS